MADVLVKSKEAIVIIIDVGRSMQYECKESPSTLVKAKACVTMILQRKIFSESKDEMALVLCGTPETDNRLARNNPTEYNHIVVAQGLKPVTWDLFETVSEIEGSETSADLIKGYALLVAMDLLENAMNGKKFFSRRILFLSQFDQTFCGDKVDIICDGLKSAKIDLNLIGPYAISNDDCLDTGVIITKTPLQIQAEIALKQLLKAVDGESYSFEEAVPALVYYQKKTVQSLPWNANLDIGKNLTIPISAYIKVYETKPKPWKNAFARKFCAKIEKETTYHLNDEAQTEVPKEEIISAFRYGTTLVPFSEEDKVNMEYQSGEKGMKVLGFTKEENVRRYYYIGDKTMYVFGQKNRELSGVILAPFIQALYETKMVAIVRYVYSARSAPKIGFLSPRIKSEYECLVFVALPFLEDLRHFVFAPLDSNPKNLPTDDQLLAIDDLITSMDLSTAASDEDSNRGEALKSKNTVNPYLQRMYQCLQHKVFDPVIKPIPEIPAHIHTIIDPHPELLYNAEPALKKIKRLFPLRDGSKNRPYDNKSSLFSNGSDDKHSVNKCIIKNDLFGNEDIEVVDIKVKEVGTVTPVDDFKYLINSNQGSDWFEVVCKQMGKAVMRLLTDSMRNMQKDKILSCLSAFRNASIEREQPFHFNNFMKSLKGTLISRSKNLWTSVIEQKLSLITTVECFPSTVSFQEAVEFSTNLPEESIEKINEDEKDLLEEL